MVQHVGMHCLKTVSVFIASGRTVVPLGALTSKDAIRKGTQRAETHQSFDCNIYFVQSTLWFLPLALLLNLLARVSSMDPASKMDYPKYATYCSVGFVTKLL